jgi:2-amino-4-hydroxy-6-hydroxymethyldihydropteridine diphosphokinase
MAFRSDVYVGLGSNLNNPPKQLHKALRELSILPMTRFIKVSRFYRTQPLGRAWQPAYLNAVAWLNTGLQAIDLLDRLQVIESSHGRLRSGYRWGARVLDLDILLFGDSPIDLPRLTVPHYGLAQRDFVVLPLLDIAPNEMQIPGFGRLSDLASKFT